MKKNEVLLENSELQLIGGPIEKLIYEYKENLVILDSNLAFLYGIKLKSLNQIVKDNIKKFPKSCRFRLNINEINIVISNLDFFEQQNLKKYLSCKNLELPYFFTQKGIIKLGELLNIERILNINKYLLDKFIYKLSKINLDKLNKRLETVEFNQWTLQKHQYEMNNKINEIINRIEIKNNGPQDGIFFEGEIFDAYLLISKLIRKALERVIIIDNYVDEQVLNILDKRSEGVKAIIYTNIKKSHITLDLLKHNAQYPPIEVKNCINVHDRFLIIDKEIYLIGGSIKDLGKKLIAFSKLTQNPDSIINQLKT